MFYSMYKPEVVAEYNSGRPLAAQLLPEDIRISEVSRVLDEAEVPNVLWAEYMLSCFGVPTLVWGTHFIVPDELVLKAYDALLKVGFLTCVDASTCPWYDKERHRPYPAEHLHAPPDSKWEPRSDNKDDQKNVILHRKSHMIFSFPDIPFGAPAEDDIYYMNADSTEIRDAVQEYRFRKGVYPIKVPRPTKLFEALYFLRSRDITGPEGDNRWVYLWESWICYLGLYVKQTGLFREDDLDERFHPAFREMMDEPKDRGVTMARVRKELKARLVSENALPPPPRPDVNIPPELRF